jgi:hypothetical protein
MLNLLPHTPHYGGQKVPTFKELGRQPKGVERQMHTQGTIALFLADFLVFPQGLGNPQFPPQI